MEQQNSHLHSLNDDVCSSHVVHAIDNGIVVVLPVSSIGGITSAAPPIPHHSNSNNDILVVPVDVEIVTIILLFPQYQRSTTTTSL